jgi:hypothetical protein
MKRLLSLIFAITLLTSVNIHARAIDSDVVPSQDDSNVTTIRKATMATYEQSFTWDEFTTIGNPNGGSNWTECDMQFYRYGNTSSRPHLRLCFCVKDDGARTYYSSSGTAYYFPQNGTYTIGTSLTLFTVGAYNNSWSYNWDSQF